MTPERLAKVAALAELTLGLGDWKADPECGLCRRPEPRICPIHAGQGIAAAVAPLLGEFQAEDEARGAARVREAVEAQIRHMLAVPPDVTEVSRELMAADLHIALDAAEKAAVEGVAGAVAGEDAQSGRGDAGGAGGGTGAHKGSCAICGWKWERGCPA